MSNIITVPFGYLMDWLYQLTNNYGWALILFAVLVKLIMLPITAKGKKSMMKMSRLTPKVQALQKKYANDQQKQSEALRELYKEEGVSMGGGCLWSFIPLLILIPLYSIVRDPLTYMLHESAENIALILSTLKNANAELFAGNEFYHNIIAAGQIPNFAEEIKAAIPNISEATLAGVNFNFLGINLGGQPQFNVFAWSKYDWAHIGGFLIPLLSAGSQVLSMFISNKMNNSLVTDEKGLQDKETAAASQTNQTNKVMMWTMPLFSLWIGFTVPTALSLYWLIQGVVSIAMDVYLTKKYRTLYDAEDAARLQKALEIDAIQAEKERVRAERRAANPDGITENTSKKKLHQQQQREQEAARAAAAREYAEKKGKVTEEDTVKAPLSGIAERPNCKGRAYDPNRYNPHTTEE